MTDNVDLSDKYGIDTSAAHPARIYDYLLGGDANFAVDREAVDGGSALLSGRIEEARINARYQRDFLANAVRFLAGDAGVRQFLDIGTGIPNADNVHGVAQATAADARVVYVDKDPVVVAHAHQLLRSTPEGATDFVQADLREPAVILERAADTLDFTKPVAVVLVGILHFIPDEDDPYGIVNQLLATVPAGSYLAVSHLASDIKPEETAAVFSRVNEQMSEGFVLRSRDQVAEFFTGLELVEPGLVRLDGWRTASPYPDGEIRAYACVGRKT